MKFQKRILSNGLRVIYAPIKNTSTVTILVMVGTGSKYEKFQQRGISHFLEHMFFKGTSKRPSPLSIAEELDAVGGSYNAFTSKEVTGYYAKVADKHFDLAMDVVADILLNSTFNADEMKKEKGVIIEELNMYRDTPLYRIQALFERVIFGNQPAGWETIGTRETISRLNRKNLISYFKSHYRAPNTAVIISGNISQEKAFNKVESYFKAWKRVPISKKSKTKANQSGPRLLLEYKETDQTHLCLGVQAYSVFDPRRMPLNLLSVILGANMSSRLFINLREKHGMAYYVKSQSENYSDSGYLLVQAGVPNQKISQAINIILDDFKRLKREKVGIKELTKAKEYLKGKTLLGLESSDEVASFVGEQEIITRKIIKPEEFFKKIDAVTPNDIVKVAQNIFLNRGLNLALIGPIKNRQKSEIKRLLKV